MNGLTQEALLVKNRLASEHAVARSSVQDGPVVVCFLGPVVHHLGRKPALGSGRQGVLESTQLRVLMLERLITHRAQLHGALLVT